MHQQNNQQCTTKHHHNVPPASTMHHHNHNQAHNAPPTTSTMQNGRHKAPPPPQVADPSFVQCISRHFLSPPPPGLLQGLPSTPDGEDTRLFGGWLKKRGVGRFGLTSAAGSGIQRSGVRSPAGAGRVFGFSNFHHHHHHEHHVPLPPPQYTAAATATKHRHTRCTTITAVHHHNHNAPTPQCIAMEHAPRTTPWRGVGSKGRKTTPTTTSTTPVRQLLGSANVETTRSGTQAAAADRTQRPDTAREGKNG